MTIFIEDSTYFTKSALQKGPPTHEVTKNKTDTKNI